MELREMSIEELEARKSAIASEVESEGADLNALEEEVRAINEEMEQRKAIEAQKNEIRSKVAAGAGVVVKQAVKEEERKAMKVDEIRASKAYEEAFADGIKSKDFSECRRMLLEASDAEERGLMTTNATNGTVSVPVIVYDIVKNAWENDAIASRVKRTYLQGNLKVDFEISSTGATAHAEGASVDEETLVLGTVDITPVLILKWISITKEAADLRGAAFLQYVYDELVHQIAKKAVDTLIAKIDACGTEATSTCVGVPAITATSASVGLIAEAMAELSDQAQNPVVMMNRQTWGAFKTAQYANKFNTDPFEGLPVLFNNTIKSISAATTGDTYVIVGDLGEGAMFNFPNGEDGVEIVEDRLTLATSGKVKEIGSEFIGIGVVGPNAFVKITK
jgi:HK97 family phage major capsid protein